MTENSKVLVGNKEKMGVEYKEIKYNYFLPKITPKKIPYAEHVLKSLDGQLPLRPKEVVYCKRCVLSNQRPRTTFDKNGVCSACGYKEYKNNHVDRNKRKAEFEALLDKYRRRDGKWDVIVPCSGGKDSGSVAHKLKYKHGMNPLCVTWSPLLYTHIGMQNFQNMILSGLDSYLCSPNRMLQRKISRLCFVLQGDHFEAFSRGQFYAPIYIALKEGIKLIMLGEDGDLEYTGSGTDSKSIDISRNSIESWDKHYYKSTSFEKLLRTGLKYGYLTEKDFEDPSMVWYKYPLHEEIEKAGIAIHWYGWYFNWIPKKNCEYVADNYKFQKLPRRSESTYSRYASLDDVTDPFHFYMSLIKFGIGRATSDAAHEIRDGCLTREEAVELVRKYDQEFPEKYFKDFLEYVDMTEEEFWSVINAYRSISPHLWEKVNGGWRLKHQVS